MFKRFLIEKSKYNLLMQSKLPDYLSAKRHLLGQNRQKLTQTGLVEEPIHSISGRLHNGKHCTNHGSSAGSKMAETVQSKTFL